MADLRERVARAIAVGTGYTLPGEVWESYLPEADAVLAELGPELQPQSIAEHGKRMYDRGFADGKAAAPQAEVERALKYLDRYLSASLAAPDWAIHLASILTGGDGAGAFRDAAPQPQAVNGYTDRDRACIVSSLQSARDRMARVLPKHYGEGFDGDLDAMLDAINWMKRNKMETK